MYCPKCGDEFRPGFSVCPDCRVSLVDAPPPETGPSASKELVTIATFASAAEASLARGALETEGIAAFVPGEGRGVFALSRSEPQMTWAELKVRPRDRDRALRALKHAGHR